MKALKRLLAILLLAVFGLPLASPLFAMSPGAGSSLPACCRRAGKHHCMGDATTAAASSSKMQLSGLTEKCPYLQPSIAIHPQASTPSVSQTIFASLVSHPCGMAQAQSKWRIARERSRLKRGPPASS